jgi:protein TonB
MMHVPESVFDTKSAFDQSHRHHLMRAPPPPTQLASKLWAASLTAIAHIAIVISLIVGIQVARPLHEPATVLVHIDTTEKKAEDLPPPPEPMLMPPSLVNAPIPDVKIAAQPRTVAAQPSEPASPPVPPPPRFSVTPSWQGQLLARLERAKHYPESAKYRHQQGVVTLRFVMDRAGRVLSSSVVKSAGFDVLDKEALATLERAQPLPEPPAEVPGSTIALVVNIEFFLNPSRH